MTASVAVSLCHSSCLLNLFSNFLAMTDTDSVLAMTAIAEGGIFSELLTPIIPVIFGLYKMIHIFVAL
jgi:hypothetical protein